MKNKGDIQRKRLISKFLDGRKIFVQKFDLVLGEMIWYDKRSIKKLFQENT